MFPIATLRAAFPALNVTGQNGLPLVYFDNPAGTQVPIAVAQAISDAILYGNANLGGAFETSKLAGDIHQQAHRVMAEFLGSPCQGECIVIAQSMTAITYNFSRTLAQDWQPDDEIIITTSDHDGNVAPWLQAAEDSGACVRKLHFREDTWQLHPDDLAALLSPKTRLVALNYANNMTGSVHDLGALIALAKQAGAQTYVDAVQYAPHGLINFAALDCDYLVCSSYKFFGPHLGILVGKPERLAAMRAYKVGPAPNSGSGKFEHGTPQIELLAGLIACIEYFADLGRACGRKKEDLSRRGAIVCAFEAQMIYEKTLSQTLISGLQQIDGITIHGISAHDALSERVPTVSITAQQHSSRYIAAQLAARGVSCWSGHNYALETATQLGLDLEDGVVRLGMAHYNTLAEIDLVLEHLREILK